MAYCFVAVYERNYKRKKQKKQYKRKKNCKKSIKNIKKRLNPVQAGAAIAERELIENQMFRILCRMRRFTGSYRANPVQKAW